jgi:hypothetical protein
MVEKFIESIESAQKSLQIADHMTYITFPIVKEKRLLLKILSNLNTTLLNTINSVLQYEYYYKRISIYNNARDNFNTFKTLAPKYNINPEQLKKIIDILTLAEKHRKSPFEFVKNDKIIIMSEGMQTDTLTLEKIKNFLIEAKDILRKVNAKVKS